MIWMMKPILQSIIFTVFFLLSAGCGKAQDTVKSDLHTGKVEAVANKPADPEKEKVLRVFLRSNDKRFAGLVSGAMWTAIHDYKDTKNVDRVVTKVQLFWKAFEEYLRGNKDDLEAMGGFAGYADFLVETMEGDDQAFRVFAATLAGVSGASEFGPALLKLSERKVESDDLIVHDRGRAAMAIGMIGADEYTLNLVNMLDSENAYDRGGAALGLGFLKAVMHREKIESLLRDTEETVRNDAKYALNLMDGK